MRQTKPSRWIPALLVVLAVAVCSVAARADEPFENLMPEGCIVCVTVRSVPDVIEPVKALPQVRLLSEPAMEPLLQEFMGKFEEMRTGMSDMLGVTPEQALGILGGQVCLGVLPPGDRDTHYLLLADVTGNPELAATVVQNLLQHERDKGTYDILEEEFRGHAIYHIRPIVEEKDDEGNAGEGDAAGTLEEDDEDFAWDEDGDETIENPGFIMLSDGVLAVASSPDRTLLERYLVLRDGESLPAVGTSDNYRRVQSFLGEAPEATVFVDIKAAAAAAGEEADDAPAASVPLAFAVGLDLTPDGVAAQGLLLAPRPREGIMRAFMPQGDAVMPPAFADKDGALIAGLHFSVPVLWDEIIAKLQRDNPEQYMQFQQGLLSAPVDVENDVIRAFGNRWFLYLPGPTSVEGDPMGTSMAFVADLSNPEAFAIAWKKLLTMIPPVLRVDTIDFMGVGIQQFTPVMGMPSPEVRVPQPCIAVMGDKLVLTSGLEVAKGIIQGNARQASPLLSDQVFQQLLGRTMDNPDVLVYLNGQAMGKLMKAQAERQARMAREMGYEDGPDPDEVPWDVLQKYSSDTMATAKWIDEGLEIKAWSPAPAQAE